MFNFASLEDLNFFNKSVLVRCDFNEPLKNGLILDDFRLKEALPTINYLKKAQAKVILLSHLSHAEDKSISGSRRRNDLSLKPIAQHLGELLKEKVFFVNQSIGRKATGVVNKLKAGQVLLLENLRFEKGEEANDYQFATNLAKLGQIFVAEDFSVCHREHASVALLPKLLPHCVGFRMEKELVALSHLLEKAQSPFVVIIGGDKLLSKIKVISSFLKKADHILLGGKVVNAILSVKGITVGKPWPEQEVVSKIISLNLDSPKIHMPLDVLVSCEPTGQPYQRESGPGKVRKEEEIFDIGPETIKKFGAIIKEAKTILWAGPLGLIQTSAFKQGTLEIAKEIAKNEQAFRVVGGGDTVASIKELGLLDHFSFVSTGGGAMLAFLAGDKMPGLEALKN